MFEWTLLLPVAHSDMLGKAILGQLKLGRKLEENAG